MRRHAPLFKFRSIAILLSAVLFAAVLQTSALGAANRRLNIQTPFGPDVLVLTDLNGSEELSRLFHFQMEMYSEQLNLDHRSIVGQSVTISLSIGDKVRYINGFVSRFTAGEEDEGEGRRNYSAEVVPWLWFLTRTSDCRVFQSEAADDIVEQIFREHQFLDFSNQASATPTEFCVQYRETDFNFVSRLMEEEGIFYFFQHEAGKHTLVMANSNAAFAPIPDFEQIAFNAAPAAPDDFAIVEWDHSYEFRSGKYAQTDYNFEIPSTSLLTEADSVVDLPGIDKYELFDYPGNYATRDDGEDKTRVRMQEEEVPHNVAMGASNVHVLAPGAKFQLTDHPSASENGGYVITSIQHSAHEGDPNPDGSPSDDFTYSNRFVCIPDSVPFRPARTTPKPVVQGPQTAVVVGPDGEEIWPDEYGRVKVQFHWDREGQNDENSSCWIRVAQDWAGHGGNSNYSNLYIPRIGQEVVVDFLEGNPDRPIITGRVYNAEDLPPIRAWRPSAP